MVDSAFEGSSLTRGRVSLTRFMSGERLEGRVGRRCMFLAAERRETLCPFWAIDLESSRKGIM
ncbi:hypothetical protein HanXRQr2_Chr14g0646351 [Helianthus annuus]|uniref:Uncharacterized protein n=1 Tax=Helianthus annuus TaxID=4232 RepID=A0A9K3E9Z3_HELAN|nr:hypothetical protein HanXRQr2_Chr14g0646351 [Helianthus annuus]